MVKTLLAFFQLLRPINLFLVAATACALRYAILLPLIGTAPIDMQPTFSEGDFALLVLMLVLLTGAGNIINDYFDLRVDRINKPQRVVIDKLIKRRVAMAAHVSFNVLAVIIGLYLSWRVQNFMLAAIPFFIAGSLWYYSVSFKKQFLIGNLVVAIMASLLPLLVGVFEIPLLFDQYIDAFRQFVIEAQSSIPAEAFFILLWTYILGYAAYAFVITLSREILKDMEDLEGDQEGQYKTLPIVWGIKTSRMIVSGLLGIVIASLIWLQLYLLGGQALWTHIVFDLTLVIPLIMALFFNAFGQGRSAFARASASVKIAMGGMLIVTVLLMILIKGSL